MLKLEAIDAIGINPLDVEIIKVLIDAIDHPNSEGKRISVIAQINPVDVEMIGDRHIAVGLQDGIGTE